MSEEQYKKLKASLLELIEFYYSLSGNSVGGNLHIILDDGNIEDDFIYICQCDCEKNNDSLGLLISTLLRYYTLNEREYMYENDWRIKPA